jgi:hypothetical protein
MANHDPNHSSKERTILWIILPATVAVSLLFTKLNHTIDAPAEKLNADLSGMKKEVPAAEHKAEGDTTHVVAADTTRAAADTTHAAPHGAGH